MECWLCGGDFKPARVTFVLQADIAVVENVPAAECGQCGERLYSSRVARALEAIGDGKIPHVRTMEVKVYDLGKMRLDSIPRRPVDSQDA